MITRFDAKGSTVFYHLTCMFKEYYHDILAQNIAIATQQKSMIELLTF